MALVSNKDMQALMGSYLRDKPLLEKLDRYHQGAHDTPFIPRHASDEYKLVTSRCYTNFMRQAVAIPTQTLYVDGFRSSRTTESPTTVSEGPEWTAWQRSRMDSIQSAVYSGAFVFGYSLVVTEIDKKTGAARMRGISAMKSSAVFDDPANDIAPRAAIEFLSEPYEEHRDGGTTSVPGRARVWGETHVEEISWDWTDATHTKAGFKRLSATLHGASECPVTRFAASTDLEGRCIGIVEPLIQLQDRINQSVHDLLIAQVYSSFQVRTATGMSGMVKQVPVFARDYNGDIEYDPDTGMPVIEKMVDAVDDHGRPILADTNINAATMLISEDKDTKFGVLPGAPLNGFIEAINLALRHFATLSATPPHYMMGSITNISADALQAAEIALKRKIDLFKVTFGESWERVVNISAELDGFTQHDEKLETLWRDMEGQSFARISDALLKLKELGIPAQGLWAMLPGITAEQLAMWERLVEEDPDQVLISAIQKGTEAAQRPDGQQPTDPNQEQTAADPELE